MRSTYVIVELHLGIILSVCVNFFLKIVHSLVILKPNLQISFSVPRAVSQS